MTRVFNKVLDFIKTPLGVAIILSVCFYAVIIAAALESSYQQDTINQQRQQIDGLLIRNAEQQVETEEQRTKANALQDEIWNYREHMQKEATE